MRVRDDASTRGLPVLFLVAACLAAVFLSTAACGQTLFAGAAPEDTPSTPESTAPVQSVETSSAGLSTSSLVATSSSLVASTTSALQAPLASGGDIDSVFADLARVTDPMTIFAPTVLPDDAVVAERWLPVVESSRPDSIGGPRMDNPRVVGTGADAEIQVVFRTEGGYLALLENFQGDLGDAAGTPVGNIAGCPARFYEVNDGQLVQWSKDGRWYGVFGRGVGRDAIITTALGMQPTAAGFH